MRSSGAALCWVLVLTLGPRGGGTGEAAEEENQTETYTVGPTQESSFQVAGELPGAPVLLVGEACFRPQHQQAGDRDNNISLRRLERADGPIFFYSVYVQFIPVAGVARNSTRVQHFLFSQRLPRNIRGDLSNVTNMNITTECAPETQSEIHCRCFQGYQWNNTLCEVYPSCDVRYRTYSSCTCLKWTSASVGYCKELPASPGSLRVVTEPIQGGDNITLVFSTREELIRVRWYLVSRAWDFTKEIYNGTEATLRRPPWGYELVVTSNASVWEGKYVCLVVYKNFQWEESQDISLPLLPEEIIRIPAQITIQCASFSGMTLQCCIRDSGKLYSISWDPATSSSDALNVDGHWCHSLSLDASQCPEHDVMYHCGFENKFESVQAAIPVSVIQPHERFCPSEYHDGVWNATRAGDEAMIPCPDGKMGSLCRSCSLDGVWGHVRNHCMDKGLLESLQLAEWLHSGIGNPHKEIPSLIKKLRIHTMPGDLTSPRDLNTAMAALETITRRATDTRVWLNRSTIDDFLAVASQILDADSEDLWSPGVTQSPLTGPALLQSVENITKRLHLDEDNIDITQPNVELQGSVFGVNTVRDYNRTFSTNPKIYVHISKSTLAALLQNGNITLTSVILKNLERKLPSNFGDKMASSDFFVNSLVLINTIMSNNLSVGETDIEMMFGHKNTSEEDRKEEAHQCVFWNHSMFEGKGAWSAQGCQTFQQGTSTVCRCKHLTSFSILLSMAIITPDVGLELLSKFGTCISILSLILGIIIDIRGWKLAVRNRLSNIRYITLINVSVSLLIADLWSFASFYMTKGHKSNLCVAATFFKHLFHLAMFFWMFLQGLILFHQFLFVFHELRTRSVVLIMVTVGYLCPLAIAVVTLGIYYPCKSYIQDGACWLNGESGASYAFVVPVLITVLVKMLILLVVIMKLFRPQLSEEPEEEDKKTLMAILKPLLIFTTIFGLTWVIGLVTIILLIPKFFLYLFTILNSFQGVFILVFGLLMSEKVKEALLRCFRQPSPPILLLSFVSVLPRIEPKAGQMKPKGPKGVAAPPCSFGSLDTPAGCSSTDCDHGKHHTQEESSPKSHKSTLMTPEQKSMVQDLLQIMEATRLQIVLKKKIEQAFPNNQCDVNVPQEHIL